MKRTRKDLSSQAGPTMTWNTKRKQCYHKTLVGFLFLVLSLCVCVSRAYLRRGPTGNGPWVLHVEINFVNASEVRRIIDDILQWADVWRVDPDGAFVVVFADDHDYERLVHTHGVLVAVDAAQTVALPTGSVGQRRLKMTNFHCYRTVEATYQAARSIVGKYPHLATIYDIGQSWEKTRNLSNGYDLLVLKIARKSAESNFAFKPKLFLNCAIHPREYATAELCLRFAEYVVGRYFQDPDITWIIDHHEIHINLISNPDGRKKAEDGILWRKNTNDNCPDLNTRGVDLNRNFQFAWSPSMNQCVQTFSGPYAASEPEVLAVQNYLRFIFPDQRGPELNSPAPLDSTGIMLDIHSYGEDVLWSWGFTKSPPPNDDQLWTLGRKYAYYTGYRPQTGSFSTVTGATKDFAYGELGVPSYTIEIGTNFFQDCKTFEAKIVPENFQALLYMAKVVRSPYMIPAGPETVRVTVKPSRVTKGDLVTLNAIVDDGRYSDANGQEPTQSISAAEAFIDVPPWDPNNVPIAMSARDGNFDSSSEEVVLSAINTSGLSTGRHILFVRGIDSDRNKGALSAVFLHVYPL